MSIDDYDRALFNRVWAAGAKAIKDNRITALVHVALETPTLDEYQGAFGQRMTDMIKVVQLGISQLRANSQIPENSVANLPRSTVRSASSR
jgi:hypothetical protein